MVQLEDQPDELLRPPDGYVEAGGDALGWHVPGDEPANLVQGIRWVWPRLLLDDPSDGLDRISRCPHLVLEEE